MTVDERENAWRDLARATAGLDMRPRPRVGRTLLGGLLVLVAGFVLQGLARNPNFGWPQFGRYFFNGAVIQGLGRTIELTVLSMLLAIVVAIAIANMRLSSNSVLRAVSGVYVWFFRSIPLLVLLILGFNFSIIYPKLSLGVPFGPEFFSLTTQQSITAFSAAVLAFGLQQAAYTSETIRAALLAVPVGQREAACALGMTHWMTQRRIVLPQAMRIAVPPVGNDTINMLKGTSLVAFISTPDLLYSVQQIYSRNYEIVPLLMVACIWYMLCVSVLSVMQFYLEKRMARGRGAKRRVTRVPRADVGVGL